MENERLIRPLEYMREDLPVRRHGMVQDIAVRLNKAAAVAIALVLGPRVHFVFPRERHRTIILVLVDGHEVALDAVDVDAEPGAHDAVDLGLRAQVVEGRDAEGGGQEGGRLGCDLRELRAAEEVPTAEDGVGGVNEGGGVGTGTAGVAAEFAEVGHAGDGDEGWGGEVGGRVGGEVDGLGWGSGRLGGLVVGWRGGRHGV